MRVGWTIGILLAVSALVGRSALHPHEPPASSPPDRTPPVFAARDLSVSGRTWTPSASISLGMSAREVGDRLGRPADQAGVEWQYADYEHRPWRVFVQGERVVAVQGASLGWRGRRYVGRPLTQAVVIARLGRPQREAEVADVWTLWWAGRGFQLLVRMVPDPLFGRPKEPSERQLSEVWLATNDFWSEELFQWVRVLEGAGGRSP